MKNLVAIVAASAALAVLTPVTIANPAVARDRAKSTEGNPTSDRTPGKQTTTPNSQVDTTAAGKTSDRTPGNHGDGAASGEQGAGMSSSAGSQSQMQAWDDTYKTDKGQEQQLKAGGKSQ